MRRQSTRTRQKNNSGDRKGKSNESPEIPDRGMTSHISGLHDRATHGEINGQQQASNGQQQANCYHLATGNSRQTYH